jgi:DnaJ-class molecular chaperone
MHYFKEAKTISELKALHVHWSFLLHPDQGGDQEEFMQMQNEYEVLLEEMQQPKGCPVCGGDGFVSQSVGFVVAQIPCSFCDGEKEIKP